MDRLTEKEIQALNDLRYYCSMSQDLGINYTETNDLCDVIEKALKELEQKRQLEKQIGCPLEVRCKLVYNLTIYYKSKKKCSIHKIYDNGFTAYCWKENRIHEEYFDYSDYKKTWWLKADRSE